MPKRAASSPAGGARKKTNADPVAPKCKEVERAIKSADGLPDSCKEMLADMVGSSLSVLASERHALQNQGVKMIDDAMKGVLSEHQARLRTAQGKVENADREKVARSAALDAAQNNLARLEQKAGAAKGASDNDKAACAQAKADVASALAAAKDKDDELESTKELKDKVSSAIADVFEPSKAGKVSAPGRNTLEKVLREINVEGGVLDHLTDTLNKKPESRGTFDGLVMKAVGEQSAQYLTKADKDLQTGEQTKTNLANAKTAADTGYAAAQEKVKASAEALDAAEAALKEGKAALKAAQAAVSGFDREMATAATDLEDAKESLQTLTDGALAAFGALKNLAPPPEPVPEPVPEAPAAVVAPAAAQ